MKLTLKNKSLILLAGLAIGAAAPAHAQSTAFTYQGRLVDDCCPATGLYDLRFQAHSEPTRLTAVGILFVTNAVPVTNGLFTVRLDFGDLPFGAGLQRWLQVEARTNNPALPFVALLPRTEMTPTPNAISALTAGTANTVAPGGVGTFALADLAVTTAKIANSAVTGHKIATSAITADKILSGQVVKSINGLTDAVNLVAGANVTLTPSGNSIQISSPSGGGGVWSLNGPNAYYNAGAVGIGTATPGSTMHLRNTVNSTYLTLEKLSAAYEAGLRFVTGGANRWWVYSDDTSDDFLIHSGGEVGSASRIRLPSANNNILLGLSGGNVGIGTTTPAEKLHIQAGNGLATKLDGNTISFTRNNGPAYIKAENVGGRITFVTNGRVTSDANANLILLTDMSSVFNGNLGIGTLTPQAKLHVAGDTLIEGTVTTGVLTITGGADIVEKFPLSETGIPKGAVVALDPENPGQLKMSQGAYDKRVAGIVSGANGVNHGLALSQEGVLDKGEPVALTGRVYVLADAASGAIEPGDLLTSAERPGHAMKATDPARSFGAIIGKAITPLNEGTGFVQVLVNLQ